MKNRGGDKFRALMKNAGTQKAPAKFTTEVMEEIVALSKGEVHVQGELKRILQQTEVSSPSKDFTYNVVQQLRGQSPQIVHGPIISKTAWSIIVLFFAGCVIFALITAGGDHPGESVLYVDVINDYSSKLFGQFRETLIHGGIIILSVCSLLLLDYFFNRKMRSGSTAKFL